MNTVTNESDSLKARVAQTYAEKGYHIHLDPEISELPFDLAGYRPDMLAVKSSQEGYVIAVKRQAGYTSVDRLRDIAEIVSEHQGWRFLLITGDDVSQNLFEHETYQPSASDIAARQQRAEQLLTIGETEGAFLILWGTLEAMLRHQAETAALPIARFPTKSLIKHLYSQGELSIEQFDQLMDLLPIRNQIVNGVLTLDTRSASHKLRAIVSDLTELWYRSNYH